MTARVMGGGTLPVFKVKDGGKVIRGVALPFGEGAIVAGPKGSLVEEVMDSESVTHVDDNLPLLVGHDRSRPPAGLVRNSAVTPQGVMVEAELVGSDDELEGWRRRFREGLSAGLSVGFTRDKATAVYERPRRPGGLPVMRPRGIIIHELSLVNWPAYPSAGVVTLSLRTAHAQHLHEESNRIIHEVSMARIEREAKAKVAAKRTGGSAGSPPRR